MKREAPGQGLRKVDSCRHNMECRGAGRARRGVRRDLNGDHILLRILLDWELPKSAGSTGTRTLRQCQLQSLQRGLRGQESRRVGHVTMQILVVPGIAGARFARGAKTYRSGPFGQRGFSPQGGCRREPCPQDRGTASARNRRPSASRTLRTVSSDGLRSPDSAL